MGLSAAEARVLPGIGSVDWRNQRLHQQREI